MWYSVMYFRHIEKSLLVIVNSFPLNNVSLNIFDRPIIGLSYRFISPFGRVFQTMAQVCRHGPFSRPVHKHKTIGPNNKNPCSPLMTYFNHMLQSAEMFIFIIVILLKLSEKNQSNRKSFKHVNVSNKSKILISTSNFMINYLFM